MQKIKDPLNLFPGLPLDFDGLPGWITVPNGRMGSALHIVVLIHNPENPDLSIQQKAVAVNLITLFPDKLLHNHFFSQE